MHDAAAADEADEAGTHLWITQVETGLARKIDFHGSGTVDCMIDGEIMSLALRSLEVLPGSLEVVA